MTTQEPGSSCGWEAVTDGKCMTACQSQKEVNTNTNSNSSYL
jgi:hypothetical protein